MKTQTEAAKSGSSPASCSPLVECPKCNGSGKVPLDRALLETWEAIVSTYEKGIEFTSKDLCWVLREKFPSSKINNRLASLNEHDLIYCSGRDGNMLKFKRPNSKENSQDQSPR